MKRLLISRSSSIRSRITALATCLLSLFLILGSRAAEVMTDQLDYQPGDTVFIIGSGFAPGETVFLQVINGDGQGLSGPWGEPWTASADQDGNVLTTWEVCPEECFEAVLHLMALGETSNEFAEAFFTDAIFNLRLLTLTSPTGSCSRRQAALERWFLEPGGTYTVTIQTVTSGPGSICFSNDPTSIPITLASNFGGTIFTVDRLPNTNQYRGTVTIPTNACGTTFLTYFCENGTSRRVMGLAASNFVTFGAARFTNCLANPIPINCGPVGQPPTIICPSNVVTTTTNSSLCGANVFYPAPAVTGSPAPSVSCTPPSGSFFPVGLRTVVCTAANTVGTAQCSFSVRVISDGTPPTITCPSNVVTTSSSSVCGANVFYPTPVATGSPAPTVSCTPPSGSFFPVGVRTVVCRATNCAGTAQCSFTVRVIDDVPPTITCTDVCLVTDAGSCTASGSVLPRPVASDNCGFTFPGNTNRLNIVSNAPATFPLGTTIVTWTATDPSGNSASCQQQVTVVSAVAVTFVSPVVAGTNEVTDGQNLPVKVQLADCAGAAVLDGLTATINVRGIGPGATNVFDNVIELASGTGTSGTASSDGILELRGNHEHFNLQTANFVDADTAGNPQRFYRVTVTIFNDATACAVGSASFILETRPP